MATGRNIMRGTFRLSVAVAVLAAAYGAYERIAAFSATKDRSLKMMVTLECGSRLSEETLRRTLNEHGLPRSRQGGLCQRTVPGVIRAKRVTGYSGASGRRRSST